MKVIQEQKTYNHTYTVKRYQAQDGTVFDDERDCLEYDFRIISNKRKPPLSAGSIRSLDDESCQDLVFLKTKEDFDYIVARDRVKSGQLDTDFFDQGEGWYLYWTEDGGDWPDSYYIKNYNRYLEEAKQNLEEWIHLATDAIDDAMCN